MGWWGGKPERTLEGSKLQGQVEGPLWKQDMKSVLVLWASFYFLARETVLRGLCPGNAVWLPVAWYCWARLWALSSCWLAHVVSLSGSLHSLVSSRALSLLVHRGLATQVEQTFIFLRFTLYILTNPLPATRVAPLQLRASLISMVTEDVRSSGFCLRELVCTSWLS